MDSSAYREWLRCAWSYLEKARANAPAGPPGLHVVNAQAIIADAHNALDRELTVLAEQLRDTLNQQDLLSRRVMSGRIKAAKANRQNRDLNAQVAQVRSRIAEYNALCAAVASSQLGGPIDLPLDEYPNRIARIIAAPAPAVPRRRISLSPFSSFPPLIQKEPTLAGIQLKPTRFGLLVWCVCVVAALVVTLTCLGVVRLGSKVGLEVTAPDPQTGLIRVTCRNHSSRAIDLRVPWNDDTAAPREENAPENYGLDIYVLEKDSKQFRRAPFIVDAWIRERKPLREAVLLELGPALSLDLNLDPNGLGNEGLNPEALRIALTNAAGRIIRSHDLILNKPQK